MLAELTCNDYRRALERLPERTDENAAAVDEIAALLRATRAQPS
ncbi:hypothetical protein [Nocardia abscessus]|nr:hypothetical protein [Nocardia abscessus]